jgi:hypothetical protein
MPQSDVVGGDVNVFQKTSSYAIVIKFCQAFKIMWK